MRVLAAVLGKPDVDLTPLLREDVIREVRRFPEFECAFSHGLLHEAVLATLTPTALRRLSGRVGEVFEQRYADELDLHLDKLAFHFYRSDDAAKALRYLESAADAAAAAGDQPREDHLLNGQRRLRPVPATRTPNAVSLTDGGTVEDPHSYPSGEAKHVCVGRTCRRTSLWVLREGAKNGPRERLAPVVPTRERIGGLLVDDRSRRLEQSELAERRAASDARVHHTPQPVHVARPGGGFPSTSSGAT